MTRDLAAGLAGVLIALAAPALGWLYGQAQYRAGQEDAQADQERAELLAFRREAARLGELSASLATTEQALRTLRPTILETYNHAASLAPLPAGCLPDAGRLQPIQDAISAARAAVQSGAALPAARGSGGR